MAGSLGPGPPISAATSPPLPGLYPPKAPQNGQGLQDFMADASLVSCILHTLNSSLLRPQGGWSWSRAHPAVQFPHPGAELSFLSWGP